MKKKFLSLLTLLALCVTGAWADSESHVADDVDAVAYEGTAFDFSGTDAGASIATNKSTATATDDDELTFTNAFLPSGTTGESRYFSITANKDITSLKIYYTMSDSKFTTKDQSKSGNLIYQIDSDDAVTSSTTGNKSNKTAYVETISNISENAVIKLYSSANRLVIFGVYATYPSATVAPTITTDLSSTADVTVGIAQTFSIVATDASSYQWYKDDVAVSGATSASYTYTAASAGDVEIYCNAINAVGTTKSTVCTVTATMPASAPTITTDINAAYDVIKGNTQELTIEAEGAASYQWYKDGVAIDGATSASYTYTAGSTIGATNEIYCAATNATGTTNSTVATMTVVGSSACELTNIKFSNGAYGAIGSATYGATSIAVPYMAGTTAPTVDESSIVISDDATYELDGNTLTVTAEDGTTNKEFTITKVAITPLSVSADIESTAFSAVPSWIFNLYGYDDSKGLKFAKAVDDDSNMRIALGNTRQYYFIGAAKTLTLTKKGTTRNVNVYVNGTKVISSTDNDDLGAIALDESAPCMVMIESNQTNGDGGFASYEIEGSTSVTVTVGSYGWATFNSDYALDLQDQDYAYAITSVADGTATAELVNQIVVANTALLIKGEGEHEIPVASSAGTAIATNYLVPVTDAAGEDVASATKYVLTVQSETVVFAPTGSNTHSAHLAQGKAYLQYPAASAPSAIRIVEGENNATNLQNIDSSEKAIKFIKNGQLLILRDGITYDALGRIVK